MMLRASFSALARPSSSGGGCWGFGRLSATSGHPDQDALFKKCSDKEIAEQLGRTLSSVENRRTRLKIRVPKPGWRFFTPEEDALLGTASDAEIAKRIGRHPSSVQSRRLKLGMAIRHNRKRRPWTPEEDALLGTASDTELAARLDRHISTVCIRRQELSIPNPYWQRRCGRQRLLKQKAGPGRADTQYT